MIDRAQKQEIADAQAETLEVADHRLNRHARALLEKVGSPWSVADNAPALALALWGLQQHPDQMPVAKRDRQEVEDNLGSLLSLPPKVAWAAVAGTPAEQRQEDWAAFLGESPVDVAAEWVAKAVVQISQAQPEGETFPAGAVPQP